MCRCHGSTSNCNSLALQPLCFTAQNASSKLKRKDFVYRLASFLSHCYFMLPDMSMCSTTCVLCVLLHISANHGGVCCHFTFGVTLHGSQTRHHAVVQDAWGLHVVPLPLFPLPYHFSTAFSPFTLILLVLPSFLSVLALPLPCSSQGFVQFGQDRPAGEND